MTMKKALMFGTGSSATHLINNLPNDRVYLAAVDNDTERHGKVFFDMPIIPPEQIGDYDFDEIVIGSYWEGTIKKQLIEDFNIPESKIFTPNKKYFKNDVENQHPFRDPATLGLARNLVKTICGNACKENVPLHIDYGTLLGIVRENDLIEWDDDVDLAADVIHAQSVQDFLLRTVSKIDDRVDWHIRRDIDQNGRIIFFSLTFQAKEGYHFKPFATSIAMKGVEDGKAVKLKSFGAWFTPAHHLHDLDSLLWEDTRIFVPNDYDGYLKFTYGDWHTPKQDVSIGTGANWQCVPIEVIKNSTFTSEVIYGSDQTDA